MRLPCNCAFRRFSESSLNFSSSVFDLAFAGRDEEIMGSIGAASNSSFADANRT